MTDKELIAEYERIINDLNSVLMKIAKAMEGEFVAINDKIDSILMRI